jgi:hypothetical protein
MDQEDLGTQQLKAHCKCAGSVRLPMASTTTCMGGLAGITTRRHPNDLSGESQQIRIHKAPFDVTTSTNLQITTTSRRLMLLGSRVDTVVRHGGFNASIWGTLGAHDHEQQSRTTTTHDNQQTRLAARQRHSSWSTARRDCTPEAGIAGSNPAKGAIPQLEKQPLTSAYADQRLFCI